MLNHGFKISVMIYKSVAFFLTIHTLHHENVIQRQMEPVCLMQECSKWDGLGMKLDDCQTCRVTSSY